MCRTVPGLLLISTLMAAAAEPPSANSTQVATLVDLGSRCAIQGRLGEAEKYFTQALDTARKLQGAEAHLIVQAESRLGAFYSQTGLPERGRPFLQDALAKLRTPEYASLPELAYACNALGMLDVWARSYSTADAYLREAIDAASKDPGEDSPETAAYETNLGVLLHLQGKTTRAEVLLHRARFIVETKRPGSLQLARVLADLSAVELTAGEFTAAEDDERQSLTILSRLGQQNSIEAASGNVLLGTLYLHQGRTAEAAAVLPDAVAAERRIAAEPGILNTRVLADAIRRLGQLRVQQGNWRDAQPLYSESLALYESNLGPTDPSLAPVLSEYARVLKHNGAPNAEVKKLEARAKAVKS